MVVGLADDDGGGTEQGDGNQGWEDIHCPDTYEHCPSAPSQPLTSLTILLELHTLDSHSVRVEQCTLCLDYVIDLIDALVSNKQANVAVISDRISNSRAAAAAVRQRRANVAFDSTRVAARSRQAEDY